MSTFITIKLENITGGEIDRANGVALLELECRLPSPKEDEVLNALFPNTRLALERLLNIEALISRVK